MESPINLFKTPKGQAQYFAAYDAAMKLWPVPYESQLVTTSYGQTHVISCGPKDASPLVLLHAGQASSTMWFPNIGDLSAKFHILALDTIGELGKSLPARPNATRGDSAAWLEGVFNELGIAKTHVVGLSRGGWLALNMALQVPHRLERVVLLSPAACFIPLKKLFSAIVQAVMRIPTKAVAKAALRSWVARDYVVNAVYVDQFTIGLLNWNWNVNARGYSGIMPCTLPVNELSQICLPVLMLIGDQDRLNPPEAIERAKRTIPQLEAEIIPHAGHFLSMEQPEIVDARILKFLAED